MCAGAPLIAILPTYESIGLAAPALLLVARLLQGLSVGSEYGTGATYLSEISIKVNRGFYASFQYFTIILGQLAALLLLLVLQVVLSAEDLRSWGWRVPLFIGACMAVVAGCLRRYLEETESEETMHRKEAGSLSVMLKHKRALGLVLAFTAGGSLYFYTFTSYMQEFLVTSAHLSAQTATTIMTVALIAFVLAQPVSGAISDRVGIKNNMLLFTGLATLITTPLLLTLSSCLPCLYSCPMRSARPLVLYGDSRARKSLTLSSRGARPRRQPAICDHQCLIRRDGRIHCNSWGRSLLLLRRDDDRGGLACSSAGAAGPSR